MIGFSNDLEDEILNGQPTGRQVVVIYVGTRASMHNADAVRQMQPGHGPDMGIPDQIAGYPVQILELGEVKRLQLSGGVAAPVRTRPLVGGISCGINTGATGTLGYFVKDARGKWYALSCAHVLGITARAAVAQPGARDGGTVTTCRVGQVTVSIYDHSLNVDAAIARITVAARPEITGFSPAPAGCTAAAAGSLVSKSGSGSGVTSGVIRHRSSRLLFPNLSGQEETWPNLIAIQPTAANRGYFVDEGDSGAVVIDSLSNGVTGVLMVHTVGNGVETMAFACPVDGVLAALGNNLRSAVSFVDPTDNYR